MEAAMIPVPLEAPRERPRLRLYDHTEALETVHEWLIESGGDLTPEIEALLDEAESDFTVKAERVALKVRELEAEAAAVKEEADRLAARSRSAANGARSLKDYLLEQCHAAEQLVVKGKLATVRVQNSPLSALCAIPADSLAKYRDLPEYAPYITEIPVSYRFDGRAAIDAAKSGEELPAGIYTEQRTHLRIY